MTISGYKRVGSIVFLTLICSFTFAQTRVIEQLKHEIRITNDPEKKLALLFSICEQKQSLSTDTIYAYALQAKALTSKGKNNRDKSYSDYYIAFSLAKKGLIDSAMLMCTDILESHGADHELFTLATALKAQLYMKRHLYAEASTEFYKVLIYAEKNNDTANQVLGKNGIGWVHMELDQYREAINWFYKSIATAPNEKYLEIYTPVFSNIAAVYNTLGVNDSAQYFITKAVNFSRKHQNLHFLANSLNILADICIDTDRNKEAEAALREAIDIRKLIGDPFYIVSDLTQLAIYYAHTSQPQKGIALCLEGIAIIEKYGLTAKLPIIYDALATNYKVAGDYTSYGLTLEKMIELKDSMYKTNTTEALAEMQAGYDVQKKENIIIQQKLDLVAKNYLLYGSLLLLLCVILLAVWLFKSYKRRQTLRLDVMREEQKLIAQHSIQVAEENERKRIAAELHDSLGAYASAIIANVDDILGHSENMKEANLVNLKGNASEIMNILRDTIWALDNEKISITSISDRFKHYVQKISHAHPGVNISTHEKINNDILLSPVHALNIFRFVQEATLNALKNSDAQSVNILFSSGERINISVHDDGDSIKPGNTLKKGNHIDNIKCRAIESGFAFTISEKKEGGNEISISA